MKTNNSKIKVALGMSGGVDSSLCANLLKEQGYDVTGVYLECWRAPGCRSEQDRKDALKIALKLGIPFKVLDFIKEYKDNVVEYFFDEYKKGLTPNPDVMCNKEIKFGMFYDWAMKEDFDFIATGHYAKIAEMEKGREQVSKKSSAETIKQLVIPKDGHKDQTYFLYLMNQDQVSHTIFPLENLNKTEVRQEAEKRNLHVSNKKDSVGICFIGDINVHEFLKERLGENPGDIVDTTGNIIGSHKGLWFYTVGQRSGFQIKANTIIKQEDGSEISKHNIPPFYVIKKNPDKNQLIVGFGGETLSDSFGIQKLHWIVEGNNFFAKDPDNLFVRIRHTGKLLKCKIENGGNNNSDNDHKPNISNKQTTTTVKLKEAIQGIAQGQSAVFYKKIKTKSGEETICLGGGIITSNS